MGAFGSIVSSLALVVSFLALAVSALTAWLTLLRKGEIRMTRPTVIYFGPDGGPKAEARPEKGFPSNPPVLYRQTRSRRREYVRASATRRDAAEFQCVDVW
jgi:hypothetical protein